jgi:SAM-dependent methyltransferase
MSSELPEADEPRLIDALATMSCLHAPGVDAFLDAKETPYARAERVRSYLRVRPGLAGAVRVLDWGCRHGASAQLVRADLGAAIELHGADFCEPETYGEFYRLSGMHYQRLAHPWRLEYPDGHFDAIIGAGVLEHVANVGAALTELWRVLRVDGTLLLTHLPNAWSWSEWLSRLVAPDLAHERRFRPRPLRRQLLDHGFRVEASGYHHFAPTTLPQHADSSVALRRALRWAQRMRGAERVWPLSALSATIWVVARKRWGF